ncbi:hypothetical protein RhiirC2_721705 [Rhizophagus irregularis]|uniref:Uncharacterized protein n=1 Tax=Rhizophagus irregularis TaxID=588596 RepID=A0A2N1M4V0_9GLOM|nr:hypothetical protein RhiirC2_721712 [Rhizophagus irregularis]PKK56685.1 hypothetical protein RhiirC2_721705 [Rhizophagus irregularis]
MGGGKKETPWRFYYCPYILRTGEVHNQRCYDPKGCKVHRNSRQVLCKECGEPTRSKYDYCDTHAKKHRSREHYHQKKQAKLASAEILPNNSKKHNEHVTGCVTEHNISASRHPTHAILASLESPQRPHQNELKTARIQSQEVMIFRPKNWVKNIA